MRESADSTATPAEPGTDAEPPPGRPRARERGRMRRRLRTQKRIREALLLDLGALVYELHRQGRREPELLQAKAAELTAVDQEVRGLADALEADVGMLAVVATGVAGTCESCGSLLSTDSRYCSACGNPAVPAVAERGRPEPELAAADEVDEEPAPRVEEPAPWVEAAPRAEEPAPWLSDSDTEEGRERSTHDG